MTTRNHCPASASAQALFRANFLVLSVATFSVACTGNLIVAPATGGTVGRASNAGVALFAEPNSWNGEPSDLTDYMTPIWIYLVNRRAEDIRVVYADFALTNSSRVRYAAISPFPGQSSPVPTPPPNAAPEAPPPARVPGASNDLVRRLSRIAALQSGAVEEELFQTQAETDESVEVILVRGRLGGGSHFGGRGGSHFGGRGGSHFGGRGGSHFGGRGGTSLGGGHYGGRTREGTYVGSRWSSTYYGYPRYHGYYRYYSPWPYFMGPPYYGPYVYVWGDRYYPEMPSDDVVQYALPEGVLHPGGKIAGFLYFQRATTQATRLDMTWNVHTHDGKSIAGLRVPMLVVED